MATVWNKLMKNENEIRTQGTSNLDRRAYSNMMLYLKEMKLHNVKNLELAEQIFMLSESSVEKLNEMHEVLTEKIVSAPDQADTEELLQSTEHLQEQIGSLTEILKAVYDRQENSGDGETVPLIAAGNPEELKELQESWKQFESQISQRLENHSSQVIGAVGNAGLDISNYMEEMKKDNDRVQDELSRSVSRMEETADGIKGVEETVKEAADGVKAAIDQMTQKPQPQLQKELLEEMIQSAVRDAVEERLANQNTVVASVIQNEMKRTLEEGTAAQRATIEAVIQNEMGRMVDEGNERQRQVISSAVHEEMHAMEQEGVFDQRESIGSVVQSEMSGFRSGLTEAVSDEIAEYNSNVKKMTDKSQQVFEESLENHERIIKKEISLVQEMLENAMEDQLESTIQQLESTKKVIKGYARAAMWASCLALIILFIDILVLS